MNKQWEKPELIIEKFELSQHVAAGCTYKPGETPDIPDIPVDTEIQLGCVGYTGQGHYAEVTLSDEYDTDGSGIIEWDEFVAAVEYARNNVMTGKGHRNHNIKPTIPSIPDFPDAIIFNS